MGYFGEGCVMGEVIDFLKYKQRKQAKVGLPDNPTWDQFRDYIDVATDMMDQQTCGGELFTITLTVNEWIDILNEVEETRSSTMYTASSVA